MSGVLLSVAFSVLIRIKPIIDTATGPTFMRSGLLVIGLATLLIAALMLTVTPDIKRMLAYSSMENMGLIAIAAAAGTTLAIAALLLHVLAHGIGKTVLFLASGQLQAAHDSTAIADITAVLRRSRLIGVSLAVGVIVLLGLPPFAMFASELAIARSLADARLTWALGAGMLLIAVAFAALARNSGRILLGGRAHAAAPAIAVPPTVAAALLVGVAASIALGITAGPLTDLFTAAAGNVGATAVSRNCLHHRLSQSDLAEHGSRPARQRVSPGSGGGPRRRTTRSASSTCSLPAGPIAASNSNALCPAMIRRCVRWLTCRFRPADSSAKWRTCTGFGRSGIPSCADWCATPTGPRTWYPMRSNAGPAPEFEGGRPFPVHHRRGARGV